MQINSVDFINYLQSIPLVTDKRMRDMYLVRVCGQIQLNNRQKSLPESEFYSTIQEAFRHPRNDDKDMN